MIFEIAAGELKTSGFLEFAFKGANNPLFAAFLSDTTICQWCAG
jgi:hypothetical protein